MFSLSYLPTAERLTVVVVKARNLKFENESAGGDPFVKVCIISYFQINIILKYKTCIKLFDDIIKFGVINVNCYNNN